ncbi:SurA N-terminal domain-containing protein [Prauserella muralis]|uniref:Uncharacterized protein n=1 Tax=Prauserella muralis TaxID=588067 RepID=A0A2V4AM04_9PSEU|nr:SurA N-terminal domain-containing protein [Prauserella muralis]PXY21267.1 hypothetical protein BAY60_27845 [Prauserella muralis]TWE30381.1 SurA-like protein [Prauserella muralis]
MTRIIRRPATLLIALIAGLVLAGCGSGPSQVNAAALVGDRTIPLGDVQQEVQWLLDNAPAAQQAKQQGKFAERAREVVRSRVVHELLSVAAQREKLSADRSEVDKLISSAGGTEGIARELGIAPERVRQVATDEVLLPKLGQRYADRLSVHYVGAAVVKESPGSTAKDQARELGRAIANDPDNAAAVIREAGHKVVDERTSLADALSNQPEFGISAVFGAPEGSVVVIQPSQEQTGWLVALIKDRSLSPATQSQSSAQQLDSRALYWAGYRQLQPIADELGVKINPRYGVWDDTSVAVVASEDEVAGYQLQSRTVQP